MISPSTFSPYIEVNLQSCNNFVHTHLFVKIRVRVLTQGRKNNQKEIVKNNKYMITRDTSDTDFTGRVLVRVVVVMVVVMVVVTMVVLVVVLVVVMLVVMVVVMVFVMVVVVLHD